MEQTTIEAIIAGIFAVFIGLLIGALVKLNDWPLVTVLVTLGVSGLVVGIVAGVLLVRGRR